MSRNKKTKTKNLTKPVTLESESEVREIVVCGLLQTLLYCCIGKMQVYFRTL